MKKRCALLIVVLVSFVTFGVANAGFDGVIDLRGTDTGIDSVVLTAPDTTFFTAGWGSHAPLDTFYFYGVPSWPASITLHGTVNSFPVHRIINNPELYTWYAISFSVRTSMVMFTEHDPWSVEEPKRIVGRQPRLDVSPSVVTELTTVKLQPVGNGRQVVRIHDAVGNVVRSFDCTIGSDGAATATWNRKDDRGRLVSGGVYLCRYASADVISVRKVLVAR